MFFHSFIVKYGLKYHLLNLVHLVSDHKLQFITVFYQDKKIFGENTVLNKDPTNAVIELDLPVSKNNQKT